MTGQSSPGAKITATRFRCFNCEAPTYSAHPDRLPRFIGTDEITRTDTGVLLMHLEEDEQTLGEWSAVGDAGPDARPDFARILEHLEKARQTIRTLLGDAPL